MTFMTLQMNEDYYVNDTCGISTMTMNRLFLQMLSSMPSHVFYISTGILLISGDVSHETLQPNRGLIWRPLRPAFISGREANALPVNSPLSIRGVVTVTDRVASVAEDSPSASSALYAPSLPESTARSRRENPGWREHRELR